MKSARTWLTAVALTSAGCAQDVQHCVDSSSASCFEFRGADSSGLFDFGLGFGVETVCSLLGAGAVSGECPTEGRVGGCTNGSEGLETILWSYDGSLSDITCDEGETKLDAQGQEVQSGGGESRLGCTRSNGPEMTLQFENRRTEMVTVYFVDAACDQIPYQQVAPSAVGEQGTFQGHVWVVRLGSADPEAEIVWRGTAGVDDAAGLVVID